MVDIKKIVKEVSDFPTLPTIYTSLLNAMGNSRASVNDIADIVAQDIATSTKLLKTVNSSVYSLQSKVDTITQAIFHLGFNEVKNLVATLSVIDIFKDMPSVGNFNILDLWKHSVAVGVITRNIGKEIGIKNVENYFLAGLIHDIGKLFFLKSIPKDYIPVLKLVQESNKSIEKAEEQILQTNHRIIGEVLAKRWQIPQSITNSIRYHDTGYIDKTANLQVASVHVANIMARTLELGYPGDNYVPEPNPDIWDVMKIKSGTMKNLVPKITEDFNQSVSILIMS